MKETEQYFKKISDEAEHLVKKFSSRNPFVIAEALGIHVMFVPLNHLKGVYKVIKNSSFIILNQNSHDKLNKIVCAHELGHHIIHHEIAVDDIISESFIYDMSRRYELEANIFACQLLLDDKTVVEYIKEGFDIEKIAKATETDINLVALKCSCLIKKGYNFIPQEYDLVFLK